MAEADETRIKLDCQGRGRAVRVADSSNIELASPEHSPACPFLAPCASMTFPDPCLSGSQFSSHVDCSWDFGPLELEIGDGEYITQPLEGSALALMRSQHDRK